MRHLLVLSLLLALLAGCGGGKSSATGPTVNANPVINCEERSGGAAGVGDTIVTIDVDCPTDSGNTVTNPPVTP